MSKLKTGRKLNKEFQIHLSELRYRMYKQECLQLYRWSQRNLDYRVLNGLIDSLHFLHINDIFP